LNQGQKAPRVDDTPTPRRAGSLCTANGVLGWAVSIGLSERRQPAAAAPAAAVSCCCECDISMQDGRTDKPTDRQKGKDT